MADISILLFLCLNGALFVEGQFGNKIDENFRLPKREGVQVSFLVYIYIHIDNARYLLRH